jgi:FtsH ternary system domain X6
MTTEPDAEELDAADLEEIPQVAASEHDIIMMARTLIMGPAAQDDIWALLCASRPCAPKIGPTCAALLEDTLRHAWRALWMRGGARPGASISMAAAAPAPGAPGTPPGAPSWASAGSRTVTISRGRLWERHAPAPLPFSTASLELLRWLVQTPFAAPASTITQLPARPLEIGDQLLVYLALDAARTTPALRVLAAQPFVRAAPLAWLGHAHALARRGATAPSFAPLTEGVGAIVVEALAGELARRWYAVEIGKRAMFEPEPLIELGAAQDQALDSFMASCERAGRRDLATFVLDAAAPLLLRNVMPAPMQLDPNTTLAVRAEARLAAGSLLRAVVRWGEWDQFHRGVRYFDDDYPAAQLLLERFETIGPTGIGRARHWLTELASLVPSTTTSDTVTAP